MHEGLLAGERLSVAVRHMEKAYLDENVREYELTKHISLRLQFPAGVSAPANDRALRDRHSRMDVRSDFPGMYMRRIRSVTLTIPCVAGPYTGVHCRLTLLDSMTRVDPRLDRAAAWLLLPDREPCCCAMTTSARRGYALCPDDPRMVRHLSARARRSRRPADRTTPACSS